MTEETRNDDAALELLPSLKEELGEDANGVNDEDLLKFLRWKPSVKRASDRFRSLQKWRAENPGLFDDSLRITKDPELRRVLSTQVIVAPPELKSKSGAQVLVGRFRNNDMTDGRTVKDVARMALYTMDRVLETQGEVIIFHDLTGFNKGKNFDLGLPKLVLGAILGHFPIRIKGIYIYNAPWAFHAVFRVVSMMFFPTKLRSRTHFIKQVSECSADIDPKDLPVELGGTTEFDMEAWLDLQAERETNSDFKTMTDMPIPSASKEK